MGAWFAGYQIGLRNLDPAPRTKGLFVRSRSGATGAVYLQQLAASQVGQGGRQPQREVLHASLPGQGASLAS
jgi:hypothetical protein